MLDRVTLRQLRIFAAAAQHLHFGRAAEQLNLTQPAVSIQLKELELEVGMPLFERMGRRTHLTAAGAELWGHVRDLLARLREADEAMESFRGGSAGQLQIAATTTAEYFAPHLLAQFRRAHPGLRIRLTVDNRRAVVRALADNTIDLAIMGRAPRELDTVAVAFARHPLAIVAAPNHALARKRRLKLAQLADETFLIRERGSGTRDAMERAFAAQRFRPAEMIETGSNETIKQAVMAGMGVSFLSLHTVGLESSTRRLVVLPVSGMPVMRDWYVVHRASKHLSPATTAFRAYLVAEGARLIARIVA
jgi:LysR family transcriptional regulator, low CO2-responsive transcriptional regulator